MIYNSLLDLVGNTPLIYLDKLSKEYNNNIYIKLESFNLTGSIKDRVAKYIILDEIKKGNLKKDGYIIEATSGNTGISIAFIARLLGYKSIIVMPENMSEERKKIISSFGARLILTNKELGMKGAYEKAKEIYFNNPGSIMIDQFNNINNKKVHYETAEEIWNDLNGNIDIVIMGIGTGGTISGVGEYLKEKNKNIKIIGIEPFTSPLISQGKVGKHSIEGIGANFIPSILNKEIIDEVITISDEEIFIAKEKIESVEGLFLGISSLANVAALVKIFKKYQNKNIVLISPDDGMKYLSTCFYEKNPKG